MVSSGLADLGYIHVNIGTLPFEPDSSLLFFLYVTASCFTSFCFVADDCWSNLLRDSKVILLCIRDFLFDLQSTNLLMCPKECVSFVKC